MTNLEKEYAIRNPKGHWFDADTLRFFQCRIGKEIWTTDKAPVYFVTSEKSMGDDRRYSSRVMDVKGNVETIGEFNSYTRSTAETITKIAADKKISAKVTGLGSLILGCVRDSEKYESDQDLVTMRKMRRNARYWMKQIKHTIHWIKGQVVVKTPKGEKVGFEDWKERTMLNLI